MNLMDTINEWMKTAHTSQRNMKAIACEQAWHGALQRVVTFSLAMPAEKPDATHELLDYVHHFGAEIILGYVKEQIPISARLELRRRAGGEKATKGSLDEAIAGMPQWDLIPTASTAGRMLSEQLSQVKGELAAMKFREAEKHRADIDNAKEALKLGLPAEKVCEMFNVTSEELND